MNNIRMSLGVVASVSLAASALAAEPVNQAARTPTAATLETLSSFVGAHATNLTVYPTAERDVVFVSYHTDGRGEHVGLLQAHRGQAARYTDFTGTKPRQLPRSTAAEVGDAQAQARTLLQAVKPTGSTSAARVASTVARISAQQQAADLLKPAPVTTAGDRLQVATLPGLRAARGDSQAMARAVLTASTGK